MVVGPVVTENWQQWTRKYVPAWGFIWARQGGWIWWQGCYPMWVQCVKWYLWKEQLFGDDVDGIAVENCFYIPTRERCSEQLRGSWDVEAMIVSALLTAMSLDALWFGPLRVPRGFGPLAPHHFQSMHDFTLGINLITRPAIGYTDSMHRTLIFSGRHNAPSCIKRISQVIILCLFNSTNFLTSHNNFSSTARLARMSYDFFEWRSSVINMTSNYIRHL